MRLRKVYQDEPRFYVTCIRCQRFISPKFADLEGEPFKAYYCGDCAATMHDLETVGTEELEAAAEILDKLTADSHA